MTSFLFEQKITMLANALPWMKQDNPIGAIRFRYDYRHELLFYFLLIYLSVLFVITLSSARYEYNITVIKVIIAVTVKIN